MIAVSTGGAARALESQRQEDCKFQASLGFRARLSQNANSASDGHGGWSLLGFPVSFQLEYLREEGDGTKGFPFKHVLIDSLQLPWVTLWVGSSALEGPKETRVVLGAC